MKRLALLAAFGFAIVAVKAQDLKKIQGAVTLAAATGNWETVKADVDKLASDPKMQGKPETYMWKARVYAAIYKNDALRAKYPDALKTADEAFQKYIQLDPTCKLASDNNCTDIAFDVYGTSFNNGIRTFNSKSWDSAGFYFGTAVTYIDVIIKNKWTKNSLAFDTTSILYAAYAYQNAKKLDQAYNYYSRLADAKLNNKEYVDIYRFVLVANSDKKNKTAFDKYLATAKELYPTENWEDYELDYFNKNYTLADKAELYDKEDAAGTLTATKYLVFGDNFYNISKEDKEKLDSAQLLKFHAKARDAFKKAYQKDNQQYIAAFNVGVLYYTDFENGDDAVRANIKKLQELNRQVADEKDPKKKQALSAKLKPEIDAIKAKGAELDKKEGEVADIAIDWFEKGYAILKDKQNKTTQEKNLTNKSVDFLANLYQYKRDKARGKDQKAYDDYDAKYKKYDALHQ